MNAQKNGRLRATLEDERFLTDIAVTGIAPADAQCYVDWLNAKTGKSYRLPTPEQWLWLAYHGATTRYPWGMDASHNLALLGLYFDYEGFQKQSYGSAAIAARVVGQLPPDSRGLYDVIGNAGELTSDCRPWSSSRPLDEVRLECVVLGGSTFPSPQMNGAPSAPSRVLMSIGYPDAYVGFRLVR